MLDESRISEALQRGVGAREGIGPTGFIFELGEQPRSDLLLLGRRELRDFRKGLFEKRGHNFTVEDSTLSEWSEKRSRLTPARTASRPDGLRRGQAATYPRSAGSRRRRGVAEARRALKRRSVSRISSASRSFSAQGRRRRAFCHSACRARICFTSTTEEPRGDWLGVAHLGRRSEERVAADYASAHEAPGRPARASLD
jgi:hypothetical protein